MGKLKKENDKKWKYHFLYKTINKKNERYYIGVHSTSDIEDGYLGSGTKIKKSIRRHGRDAHERMILEFCESRETAFLKETEIVNNELLKDPKCMNIMLGGAGFLKEEYCKIAGKIGNENFKRRLENDNGFKKNFSKKISKSNIKKPRGIVLDTDKFKNAFKDKKHKEKTKIEIGKKNSISQKGNKNSQFDTIWINNHKENKKVPIEEIDYYLESNWLRGRNNKLIKNQQTKLNEAEVIEIREKLRDGMSQKKISFIYNVSRTTIAKIYRNETYKQYK